MTTFVDRARGAVRAEDVALALWNLVALPVGTAIPGSWAGSEPSPVAGLVQVGAVVGATVALATRPSGPRPAITSARLWLLAGPLVGALALIGETGVERLGVPGAGAVVVIAFGAALLALVFSDHLPVLDAQIRRALVMPLVFVGAGIFQDISADLLDGVDLAGLFGESIGLVGSQPEMATFGLFILGMVLAGAATFFVMLVVAPRELAAPSDHLGVWIIRFVLFLVSALTGISLWFLM